MTNIVMLCQNRLRLLDQALRSLSRHTDNKSFTLTLVDDGSSDFRVKKLLRECAERRHVSLLEVSGSDHVLGKLKNIGVAWSEKRFGRGDWLYLSDCDVWFSEGWLEKLTRLAEVQFYPGQPGFLLFGGQVHPFHQPIEQAKFFRSAHDGGDKRDIEHHLQSYNILDGPSWLMRWDTWDQYGPLPETCAPGVCQSEEYPFCERLTTSNSRIKSSPGRIGVIQPHVVEHTGITQSDGKPAPGADIRWSRRREGVVYE